MLFNKKLLQNEINNFEFPASEKLEKIQKIINGWQIALKDRNLDKTKETTVEGKFLTKFFGEILGYIELGGDEKEFNLYPHPKTDFDGTEADGALGFFNNSSKIVRAVIELKDAKTPLDEKQSSRKDYDSPISQAFSYVSKFDRCDWIIVSNFRDIRLYHKDRGQGYYEEFKVLDLNNEKEFKRFYFLLCKQNLLDKNRNSLLDKLVKETTDTEKEISEEFYKDFKQIRKEIFEHVLENNPTIDKKLLLEKTQKLLDRLVFIMFCEDSPARLLPQNIVSDTYNYGIKSRERSDQRIWREFKNLFQDINEGRNDIPPPINAYNGGLFSFDEVLDNLVIKDLIWERMKYLSAQYDFDSDLNVNILGHIFEQSLSDLEQFKNELEGIETDKNQTKQKKDGIFYTLEYITHYIVEQTVGKYLEENPDKLESIKILDPACGSGAFLNQAHSFLREQHKVRFEKEIAGKTQLGIYNWNLAEKDKSILLNNIYGVDLNEESTEITKLALWLKTAKKTEPLQNLDNNIKCGNSLIDASEIAGKKAFNWNEEFKNIMEQDGFDVIIGNPPYVFAREKIDIKEKDFYGNNYISAEYQVNTFVLFIEKSLKLLKNNGYLGFIVPNSLLKISSISKLREYILNNSAIKEIINLYGYSFTKVNVETVIFILKKGESTKNVKVLDIHIQDEKNIDIFNETSKIINAEKWKNNENFDFDVFLSEKDEIILNKIANNFPKLKTYFDVKAGLQAYETGKGHPKQTKEDVKNRPYDYYEKIDETTFPYLDGCDVSRYITYNNKTWLKYGDNLAAPRTFDLFSSPRILIREITSDFPRCFHSTYLENIYLNNRSIINVLSKNNDKNSLLYLLSILNSALISFYFEKTNPKANRSMFPKLILQDLRKFPIPEMTEKTGKSLAEKTEKMIELNKKLHEETKKALDTMIKEKHKIPKPSQKLEKFYQLGVNPFIDELKKFKVKLSLSEEEELRNWFKDKQVKLSELEKQIQELDKIIDKEVYELYGLTDEEIKIIEGE